MKSRRILHCARFFYLDSSNGAAVSNRALMESLARQGFKVEALCGSVVDAGYGQDPAALLSERGLEFKADCAVSRLIIGAAGVVAPDPPRLLTAIEGVRLTVHCRPTHPCGELDGGEFREFLSLADSVFDNFGPDVLITYGGDPLTLNVLQRARDRGVATVFTLHNFSYPNRTTFVNVDAVIVGSRFSADYHRSALAIDCITLPGLVAPEKVRAAGRTLQYVVYVNPCIEKGVYAFARIADELGRRRPDIPLLVVESRGDEETLVDCGIDLRVYRNVFLMSQTADPRAFWRVARIALMPSVWWESLGSVAVEAMINGVPVIASDRGALPETLGEAGIVLSLPDRLTPTSRLLPTAEEVAPWVENIIRLWDNADLYSEHRRLALAESRRWAPEVLEPKWAQFLGSITRPARPGTCGPITDLASRTI